MRLTDTDWPNGIAMWDFSWLERRYPGGGFADWDRALDALVDRGYDVVRIDAYPHLIAADPERAWLTRPADRIEMDNEWGAPGVCEIHPEPALLDFIDRCVDRDLGVGLSTWFGEPASGHPVAIDDGSDLGAVWHDVLDAVENAGLGDAIAYVDLCNEFTAGFLPEGELSTAMNDDDAETAAAATNRGITEALDAVRASFPDHDYTVSFTYTDAAEATLDDATLRATDLLDVHIWMDRNTDFLDRLAEASPYQHRYDRLADAGERVYRENETRWREALREDIRAVADWSERVDCPLVTTESWAVVSARDWPRLDWDWIKELCAFGTREALETARWLAVSTSNFCAPQFAAMWDDVGWHRELTDDIHASSTVGQKQ